MAAWHGGVCVPHGACHQDPSAVPSACTLCRCSETQVPRHAPVSQRLALVPAGASRPLPFGTTTLAVCLSGMASTIPPAAVTHRTTSCNSWVRARHACRSATPAHRLGGWRRKLSHTWDSTRAGKFVHAWGVPSPALLMRPAPQVFTGEAHRWSLPAGSTTAHSSCALSCCRLQQQTHRRLAASLAPEEQLWRRSARVARGCASAEWRPALPRAARHCFRGRCG